MSERHMSFADIVRMYQQPLYWYIRRVTFMHEDAEDILQETFMKAYRHIWQLRDPGALKPWLLRIATNELNRYFKKRQVFSLRYYDEMDYDEIGRITGANKNTLMVSYHQARKKRRAVLSMAAIVTIVFGITFSSIRIDKARKEKEFMAFQAELADFDIFLEIN